MLNESDMYPFQKLITQRVIDLTHSAVFVDMGMGKTVSVLTALNELIYKQLEVNKVLVIGPKRVVSSTWPKECKKWSQLQNLKLSVIEGTPQQRLAAMRVKADVYLISCDLFTWLVGEHGGRRLPYDMCIVDESSKFKNDSSQKSMVFKKVQAYFSRIVILTGTPAPNGLIDLWFQIWMLDRGLRLGAYISHYKDRFFNHVSKPGSHYGKYIPTKETEKKIYKKIKDIVISMKSEDYLDLEPVRFIDIPITLTPKVRKAYEAFEYERVMELAESEVTAMSAGVMSGKLLQFAGGAIYDDEKQVHEIHDLKLQALEDLIEEANGAPVMIAYTFKHEKDRIMRALRHYNPVHFQTTKHEDDWNAGKISILVMHPASGGHGLNLQFGGSIAIWYSLNWSLELYEQWNKRLPRPGQKKQVRIFRLIAEGTEDENVARTLKGKGKTQGGLMEAVKAKFKKYGLIFKR